MSSYTTNTVNNNEPSKTGKIIQKYFSCVRRKNFKAYSAISVLCALNLLNYIDRFTLAGILREIQEYYTISDSLAGLLQTLFICSYMLLAPLFGYLGDRYSRKMIMIFGVTFWSLTTLFGSFVPPHMFWLFAIFRSLVGIGEASYSCLAPTIIGDLFTNEMRTRMLAAFYLATPVGSGLGYIIGSNVATAFSDWRWALRVTPPLGIISVVALIFLVEEPKRGGADGLTIKSSQTTIKSDLMYLMKNKSFIWITLGFTFGTFVFGGLSWWVPTFVEYAIYSNGEKPTQVSLIFGVVTCIAGLLGIATASIVTPKLRVKIKEADPIVCGVGSLIAAPLLFICILVPRDINMILYWLIVAVGVSSMCLCWTLVADMLLYTVEPTRRSIASAVNILVCHVFGDAISPYVIGAVSDKIRESLPNTYFHRFTSLQTALYTGPFFAVLSFGSYLFASIYLLDDKKNVEEFVQKQRTNSQNVMAVISDGSKSETQTEKGIRNYGFESN